MALGIPIIRAGVVAPILRWMSERGLDTETALSGAALDCYPTDDPLATIPLRAVVLLLQSIAKREGPDAPYRIVGARGLYEIGLLGGIALGGETPRDVLHRSVAGLPFHSSHEFLTLEENSDELIIDHGIQLNLPDQECTHLVQQYCCALIEMVFSMTAHDKPYFKRIQMVPHPEYGFAHLQAYLGNSITAGRVFEVAVTNDVADCPLSGKQPNQVFRMDQGELNSLQTNGSTSTSVAFLVESMMKKTKPSVDRIARSAGLSRRTLQRTLSSEGNSFSGIVENVRHKSALAALSKGHVSLGELSADLGYARQSTLTRAVRRWSGHTPSTLIKNQTSTKLDQ